MDNSNSLFRPRMDHLVVLGLLGEGEVQEAAEGERWVAGQGTQSQWEGRRRVRGARETKTDEVIDRALGDLAEKGCGPVSGLPGPASWVEWHSRCSAGPKTAVFTSPRCICFYYGMGQMTQLTAIGRCTSLKLQLPCLIPSRLLAPRSAPHPLEARLEALRYTQEQLEASAHPPQFPRSYDETPFEVHR